MKIVADPLIPYVEETFSSLGEVCLCDGRLITAETVRDAELLLVRSVTAVNSSLLQKSPVRYVATATSGVDHIDTEFLADAGIGFAHAAGSNAWSVVEYVLSSMLMLARELGFRLQDRTVGIIGCGEVGSRLQRALSILDVNCLVNDPPLQEKTENSRFVGLEEILSADLVSLHVPLTDSGPFPTRHLIDRDFLHQLKSQAILINTSRGDIHDESALHFFIKKQDCSVVLDVWQQEPDINRALLADVSVSTPHIAGYSYDAKIRATTVIRNAVYEYFGMDINGTETTIPTYLGQHTICLSKDTDVYDGLELAILSHYDVRSDSAALRRVLEIEPDQTGAWFDSLRKNYPVRREFPMTTIKATGCDVKLIDKLQQLGFDVRTD